MGNCGSVPKKRSLLHPTYNQHKKGPPNYYKWIYPLVITHLQPWFFIGFAGVISLPYN